MQMSYLDEWSLVDQEHSIALSGALETLKATTIQLPIVEGAKVGTLQLLRIATYIVSPKMQN